MQTRRGSTRSADLPSRETFSGKRKNACCLMRHSSVETRRVISRYLDGTKLKSTLASTKAWMRSTRAIRSFDEQPAPPFDVVVNCDKGKRARARETSESSSRDKTSGHWTFERVPANYNRQVASFLNRTKDFQTGNWGYRTTCPGNPRF